MYTATTRSQSVRLLIDNFKSKIQTRISNGTYLLTYSLLLTLTHSPTHSPTHSLTYSLTHSQVQISPTKMPQSCLICRRNLTISYLRSYVRWRRKEKFVVAISFVINCLRVNSLTYSLTYLLTYSLTYLLTYLLGLYCGIFHGFIAIQISKNR